VFLLPVAYSPNVYATFWSPKAAVLLLAAGFGLARVPAVLRSPARPAMLAGLTLVGIAALSTVLAPEPLGALVGLYNWGTGLVFITCLVGVFALGVSVADHQRLLAHSLLAGIAVSGAVGVLQVAVDLGLPAIDAGGRATGLAGNAVHLGALATAAAAICARRDEGSWRWVLGVVAASAVAQVSATRVALVVIAIVVLGGALLRRAGARRVAVLTLAVALGVGAGGALASASGGETATGRADDRLLAAASGGGIRVRLEVWSYARHAVLDRPVLGHGPGRFRAATSADRSSSIVQAEGPESLYTDAHNILVEHAVTTGLAGVAALISLLVSAGRRARGPLAAAAAAIVLIALAQPQSVGTTPLLFFLLGAAGTTTSQSRRTARPWLVLGAAGVAAAVVVVLGDAALLAARNSLDVDEARRADDIIGVWPEPATIVSRAYEFRALDTPDPGDRDVARAQARRWARRAIDRDRTDPSLWLELAEQERTTGRLDDAADHYLEALRHDRFSVGAMTGLGRVALAEDDERGARRWFERALAIEETERLRKLVDGLG